MALTKIDDRGLKTPIDLLDDEKIRFGTGNDCEIYGIASAGTAVIINHANGDLLIKHGGDKQLISRDDGSIELYYDDTKKFETTSAGGTLTGHLTVTGEVIGSDDLGLPDDKKINLGTGADLKLYHDGTSSIIKSASHPLAYYATTRHHFLNGDGSENVAVFTIDGSCDLYHNGNKKLETTSTGITVTGSIFCGTNGEGISFETANNNGFAGTSSLLDDYEEGVWTPTLQFGGTSTGIAYASATGGSYVKIGRQVILHGRLNISNKGSSTGTASIGGFPFTAANVTSGTSGIEGDAFFSYLHDIVSGEDHAHVMAVVDNGGTQMTLRWNNDQGNNEVLDQGNFEADTSLSFGVIYPAA